MLSQQLIRKEFHTRNVINVRLVASNVMQFKSNVSFVELSESPSYVQIYHAINLLRNVCYLSS